MNKDEILTGLYNYLLAKIPTSALNLIINNDVRVESFFLVYSGIYLDMLLTTGKLTSYSLQHTILLEDNKRVHVDLIFEDLENVTTYIELKHFSISQNRGKNRKLSFYTSNSTYGKKDGIVGDCEKMDKLYSDGFIEHNISLVCCAFITQKPTSQDFNIMINKFNNYNELTNWALILPVSFLEQNAQLGIITLQKLNTEIER